MPFRCTFAIINRPSPTATTRNQVLPVNTFCNFGQFIAALAYLGMLKCDVYQPLFKFSKVTIIYRLLNFSWPYYFTIVVAHGKSFLKVSKPISYFSCSQFCTFIQLLDSLVAHNYYEFFCSVWKIESSITIGCRNATTFFAITKEVRTCL